MNQKKIHLSAGLVLTRIKNNQREYLLLLYPTPKTYWGLCKGHVEPNETKQEAALREAYEETHLSNLELIPDFTASIKYMMTYNGDKISKEVTFFIALVHDTMDGIISTEHKALIWLPYEKAIEQVRYKKDRGILIQVEHYLEELNRNKNIF